MISRAIIIAGGKGTRLAGVSLDIPKPLFPIGGKPVLEHLIGLLCASGIRNISILIGHLGEKIQGYFGTGKSFGVNIMYHSEERSLGTAGCVLQCADYIEDDFLVIYGDLVVYMKLADLCEFHELNKGAATLVVHPNNHPYDSDIVVMDDACAIIDIIQKNRKPAYYPNCASAAVYALSKSVLNYIPANGPSDFMKDVFPIMLSRGERIMGYRTAEYVKDMGTADRLVRIDEDIRSGKPVRLSKDLKRPAVFMDRDGTLVRKIDLLHKADDLELYPFAGSAVKKLNESDYLSMLITNQPVVARNLCSIDGVHAVHNKMETLLGKEGAYLDDIFFCPHHPDGGYAGENATFKIDCDCRKPKTGMIMQAVERYNIDISASWFIGDTTVDIKTGSNAGLKTILVRTGDGGKDKKWKDPPDFIFDDLETAVDFVLDHERIFDSYSMKIIDKLCAHKNTRPFLIVVGGLARSGKSIFATTLRQDILGYGITCQSLSLDSWLVDLSAREVKSTVRDRYKYEAIEMDIKRMLEGEEISLRIYDPYVRAATSEKVFKSKGVQCLIIEGVPALDVAGLRDIADLCVYVDCDETIRTQRLFSFYRWKGMSEAEIHELMAERSRDEVPFITPSCQHADMIVSVPS